MAIRSYRVESVFTSPEQTFDFHIDQVFRCPFPTPDFDEYLSEFVYGLMCEADDQISELYGRKNHNYSLSSISFNLIGDSER